MSPVGVLAGEDEHSTPISTDATGIVSTGPPLVRSAASVREHCGSNNLPRGILSIEHRATGLDRRGTCRSSASSSVVIGFAISIVVMVSPCAGSYRIRLNEISSNIETAAP